MDAPVPPTDREDLRVRVQKAIDDFLSRQAALLDDISVDLGPLTDAAAAFLTGGKRLRPAFCYWGWRGAGGPDCPEIITAASCLELFQAAALVHDDVMDRSDLRRGQPAVHRRFAALHRASGYLGAAERFGEAGAILLGDLFLSWSDELLTGSGLAADQLLRARPTFDLMRTQLMGGQYLDVLEQVRASLPGGNAVERARAVIRFKSAKYSVEQPLLLGAALAGGPRSLSEAYSAFGLPLGEAFQLRDDVLGVFGDPGETGKPAGDDLREGKRTVLVALAMERATPAQAAAVRRHLGDPALDDSGLERLRGILVETGAVSTVEAMISSLREQAREALDRVELRNGARAVLLDLVGAVTDRSV